MAEPSRAEMISQMTGGGTPPAAPAAEPSRADMIAQMTGQPAPSPSGTGNQFMDEHPLINQMTKGALGDLPLVGGAAGAMLIGGAGSVLGPAGTVVGGIQGAGAGASIGEGASEALSAMIYGKQKPLMDSFHNIIQSGEDNAVATAAGEGAGVAIGAAGKAALATKLGSKVGELASGVPAGVIKAYADGAERIKAAFADADGSTFRMAQAAKQQYVEDIVGTRKALNDTIGKGIEDSNAVVRSEPIIENLKASAAKLNPKLDGAQIDEIQGLIEKVKAVSFDDGNMPVQAAQQLKVHFQDLADSAYGAPGTSNVATPVANAAKGAGATTRTLMQPVLPEGVAKANAQLSTLHTIEDNMNKSLLNPRKSASAIRSAGEGMSDAGEKNLADLQDMSAITRTNMVQPAQDVAAAKSLGHYVLSPSLKGIGQPLVKGAVDASTALSQGMPGVGNVLGNSVMHGSGAQDALRPTP